MICQNCGGEGMTVDEMKENGSKHWKQQALRQVLEAEAEEGFKHITYPIYDKELYRQAYFYAAEPREEKIVALEKENAELKEQNIKDCENFNKTMSETKERWNKEHYQLAKAKSIIQSFVWWHTGEDRGSINSNDLVERAKQFLSEAEK